MSKISRSTIKSIIKKYKRYGIVENRTGRGRKCLFPQRDENQLLRIIKTNRRQSLQDVTAVLNEGKAHSFSSKTIRRKIADLGYKRRAIKKHVLMRETNRRNEESFCGSKRGNVGLLMKNGKSGYSVMNLR